MTLEEIRKLNSNYQMVLSFSNNNEVVIENEDFDPNSKFMRMSKIRLGMDFEKIQDDKDLLIFRTYRGVGKTDYIVYLAAEYKIVESYRKQRSHSQTIRDTAEKQLRLKDFIKPNKDNKLNAYININQYVFNWSIKHPDKKWQSCDYTMANRYPQWLSSYMAVVKMLEVLSRKDQCEHYKSITIHLDNKDKTIMYLATGKYIAKNYYTKWYVGQVEKYRKELQNNHVSLVFKLDREA